MKAIKFTVVIKVEVLSMDSIQTLICRMNEKIEETVYSGKLSFEDGDSIQWDTETNQVEF